MPLSLFGRSSPRRRGNSTRTSRTRRRATSPSGSWSRSLSRTSSPWRSLSALSLGRSRSDVTASSSVSDTRETGDGLKCSGIGRGAFSTVVLARKGSPRRGLLVPMKVARRRSPARRIGGSRNSARLPDSCRARGPFVIDLRYAEAQDSSSGLHYFSRGSWRRCSKAAGVWTLVWRRLLSWLLL